MVDAFSNYAQDEREVLTEMDRTRTEVEAALASIVDEVRAIEKEKRSGVGVSSSFDENMSELNLSGRTVRFVPWQARTVDRLVMKLDGLVRTRDEDREELLEGSDDD